MIMQDYVTATQRVDGPIKRFFNQAIETLFSFIYWALIILGFGLYGFFIGLFVLVFSLFFIALVL